MMGNQVCLAILYISDVHLVGATIQLGRHLSENDLSRRGSSSEATPGTDHEQAAKAAGV
jgi:hypothetical protein